MNVQDGISCNSDNSVGAVIVGKTSALSKVRIILIRLDEPEVPSGPMVLFPMYLMLRDVT